MTKVCQECGEEIKEGARFCQNCGSSSFAEVSPDEIGKAEKSYTTVIIIGFLAAVLFPIAGIIIGAYLLTRKDSSEAADGKYIILVSVVVAVLFVLGFLHR